MQLVDLPNTTGAKDADLITSAAQVPAVLRKGRAATAAGGEGAINVWIDDAGSYRCERQRLMVCQDEQTFSNLRDVKKWVREALPIIQ